MRLRRVAGGSVGLLLWALPGFAGAQEGLTRAIAVPAPLAAEHQLRPVTADVQRPAGSLDLPAAPDAPVVFSAADLLAGTIGARLADGKAADGKSLWPARLPKKDRDAVVTAYASRSNAAFWVAPAGWTSRAQSTIGRLALAAEDGLDPAAYRTATFAAGRTPSASDLAEADIRLSVAAVLYARDARGGRIDPARLSALLTPTLDLPASGSVLAELAAASDPGAMLERYNPTHPGYVALKAKLAEIRSGAVARRPSPAGRHSSGFEFTTQSIAVLDDEPAPAARRAESRAPDLEAEIVSNMERWRWLPVELGDRFVAVNVPEFRLRLYEGGRVRHETRVITGKPETPTPIFSGLMEYAIVNPSWHVPPSILKNEFLPRMAADPLYAERQGYEVVRRGNTVSIRQPPGERNALGFIKFMFPNRHAVYLHDTPNRRLFSAGRRAFSHGCVRVEDPFRLADFVLGAAWTETRLKRLIGGGERTLFLPQKLPVHLMYFTLSVDGGGELTRFEDIYGHDRRVRTALAAAT